MTKTYPLTICLGALFCVSSSFAQTTKVKTITIIDGDTTISEKEYPRKEAGDKTRDIVIHRNGDEKSNKKVIREIIIDGDSDAYAYAFSMDELEDEIRTMTSRDGETEIVIRKSDVRSGDDKKLRKEEKVIIRDENTLSRHRDSESVSLSISVKDKVAKINYETSDKAAVNVSLLDESGKQILHESQKDGGKYSKEIKLDKKGVYVLTIIQGEKATTDKIIIR